MGVWLGPMKGKAKTLVPYQKGVTATGWTATNNRFTNTWQTNTLDKKTPTWAIGTGSVSIQNNNLGWGFDNVTGTVFSDAAIDLTNYSSITFDLSGWSYGHDYNEAYFFVTQAKQDLPTAPVSSTVRVSTTPSSVTLDVSSLSGLYYIGIGVQAGSGYQVTTAFTVNKITVSA